jgi:hypothetical protein
MLDKELDIAKATEEYVDNKATGVEVEEVAGAQSEEPRPWDPDQIRIHTKTFSLRQILDMIDDKEIDLAPDFQRYYVWKDSQKSSMIESILLGIPMPSFYFTEKEDARMLVVDGVQRLMTIHGFARGKAFRLAELEYLDELTDKGFDELDAPLRRRFNNTQILAHVIDPQTPGAVKFDVFKRINTGGAPLSAQEIRHCMSGSRTRSLLKRCTHLDSFKEATRGSLNKHIRMADQEVALRYIAFSRNSTDEYRKYSSFDAFLSSATDSLEALGDDEHTNIVNTFDEAMKLAHEVFGRGAFRKREDTPLNRALFDVWSVVLVEHDKPTEVRAVRHRIKAGNQEALDQDQDFVRAITQGTGDPARVAYRFSKGRKILAEALQ